VTLINTEPRAPSRTNFTIEIRRPEDRKPLEEAKELFAAALRYVNGNASDENWRAFLRCLTAGVIPAGMTKMKRIRRLNTSQEAFDQILEGRGDGRATELANHLLVTLGIKPSAHS
jgi:hypothetical protein